MLSAFIKTFSPTPLKQEIPKGFPKPVYTFKNNPLTKEGFELGRKLFYDTRLSKDGNFSCATCHQQFAAFSTYDHPLSHGFNNAFTKRNAPSLFNLAWNKSFHWDGGINHIEVQPLAPITNENEMAETIPSILKKLNADTAYRRMFRAAFGSDVINSQRILKAMAQFTASLVSANSKYDQVKNGKNNFTAMEAAGYKIFTARCVTCHPEPLFTDYSYRAIGLPQDTALKDAGRMTITNNSKDFLLFKVPSLRNVAVSAPYMHDGRFGFLSQCINHYRSGIRNDSVVDPILKNGIEMTDKNVVELISFLRTLTDTSFLKNKRFADPDSKPLYNIDKH